MTMTLALLSWFTLTIALLAWCVFPTMDYVPPSIANVAVPSGLHCEEDATITWTGIDTLGCVHVDTLYDDLAMERGHAGAPQCTPPASYSEVLTSCINPDGTLPLDPEWCDTLNSDIAAMIERGDGVIAGGDLDMYTYGRCGIP